MIPLEIEKEILRLALVEGWPPGTIAKELKVHHSVVTRVLEQAGLPRAKMSRASMIDPFVEFILEKLEEYPDLHASRLYQMVKKRGYPGGEDHFRHRVEKLRPKKQTEMYLRLRTLPGEQAQVDWGHFGKVRVGRGQRWLMAFVMVLSYSRDIFLRFYLNAQMSSFLRGHVEAFEHFGGVPRTLLYDNLKSAVLKRYGDAIQFHRTLLELAGHYHFQPRPVAPGRGNEKPRVERAIGYARTSFFAARDFTDVDDLNVQADEWCAGPTRDRGWPDDRSKTVRAVFEGEQSSLLPLPDNPFPTDELVEVSLGKTPYVRFDCNDYSVPHDVNRRCLTVVADLKTIRVFANLDDEPVATHPRSWSKKEQIEDPKHIEGLVATKRKARVLRGRNRLYHAVPIAEKLQIRLAERGANLGAATMSLLRLLDQWGQAELDIAIREALDRGSHHPHTVRLILDRRRRERDLPPPTPVELPDDSRVSDLVVRPHDLADYDHLSHRDVKQGDNDDDDKTT